ncbi:unnamed protein product [Paramecium sonneborni]|uniref:Uncharacterized protein n=1 Tax=Paramecium sonneborni TaxID=65129 RepID=A0A8S1Q4G5_9CILI|nr:unnamed protein product [Paramecium sonneborni]
MFHSNYSTPVKHVILTPKLQLIWNYDLLMNHYQELELQINTQTSDHKIRYQHILSKIDKVFNDIINNIAELQKTTLKDYLSFLLELRVKRENNLSKAENAYKMSQSNYFDEIEKKEIPQQNMYYSQQHTLKASKSIPITSTFIPNPNLISMNNHQSQTLPVIQKDQNNDHLNNNHKYLYDQDQISINYIPQKQAQSINQSLQPSNFRFRASPSKQHLSNQILKKNEIDDIEPSLLVNNQNHIQQITLQSLDLQQTQPSVPLYDQFKLQPYNHLTQPDQQSIYDDYEQSISQELSQSQNNVLQSQSKIYKKKKIFDEDQNERILKNSYNNDQFNLKSYSQSNFQKQTVSLHKNMVPVNKDIIPIDQMIDKQDSKQNYINDVCGNLGYDQFYQYLCQRYPVYRILQKSYKSKTKREDQEGFNQQNQTSNYLQSIFCTQCDQFISINQANNHTNFCMNNKQNQQNHERNYLDYLICCNGLINNQQNTKEEKDGRIVNDLAKIRYLMETNLKLFDPQTQVHQKQREYCLFALEILNQIIENPQNLSLNQQVLDLISIYQVLDQQEFNFYQQFVFLLQKANVKLQKLI